MQRSLHSFLVLGLSALTPSAIAQQASSQAPIHVNGGVSHLWYASEFSIASAVGLELATRGLLAPALSWTIGGRVGIAPVLPEGFVRFAIEPQFASYNPSVGLELGLTARGRFPSQGGALGEIREYTEDGIGSSYAAVHTSALRFQHPSGVTWSVLELGFGSHFSQMGRTLRVNLQWFNLGVDL